MEMYVRIFEACVLIVAGVWLLVPRKNKEWAGYDWAVLLVIGSYVAYAAWSNGFNRAVAISAKNAQHVIDRLVAERGCPINIAELPVDVDITAYALESGPVIGTQNSATLYAVTYRGVPRLKVLYVEHAEGKTLPLRFRIERDGANSKIVPIQPSSVTIS